MKFLARDSGSPSLTSVVATLNVTVIRNDHAPACSNAVYETEISQNTGIGASIYDVVASDQDTVVSMPKL